MFWFGHRPIQKVFDDKEGKRVSRKIIKECQERKVDGGVFIYTRIDEVELARMEIGGWWWW